MALAGPVTVVFAGVLLSEPTDPAGLFEDGGGAIAVPLFDLLGRSTRPRA